MAPKSTTKAAAKHVNRQVPVYSGYGGCTRCCCTGFEPDYRNDSVCRNCGHNYSDHD